jgi:hypothetical protein
MNYSILNFTVLVERARLLACTLGLVALTACGGGGTEATDTAADAQSGASVSDTVAGRSLLPINPSGRTNGIVLSEKASGGIVLSEADAPTETEEQDEE